jgi:Fibronectin type III domain
MLKRMVQFVFWTAVGVLMAGCATHSSRTAMPPPQVPVATPDTFTVPDPALPGQITLAWDDPYNAGQGVRSYYLYYWQAGWKQRKRVDTGAKTTYTLRDLEAGRLYTFAVAVHDGAGGRESILSNEISYRIPKGEPRADTSSSGTDDSRI